MRVCACGFMLVSVKLCASLRVRVRASKDMRLRTTGADCTKLTETLSSPSTRALRARRHAHHLASSAYTDM
eukprot:5458292-Pleurochrysis_carterae.AAC.1